MKKPWFFAGLIALFLVPNLMATDAVDPTLQIPKPGETALHILSPNVLELVRINTEQQYTGTVDSWNWVDTNGNLALPDLSSLKVIINGHATPAAVMGFKRRPLYAPQATWDLRIANSLYLQLSSPVADGQSVQ